MTSVQPIAAVTSASARPGTDRWLGLLGYPISIALAITAWQAQSTAQTQKARAEL